MPSQETSLDPDLKPNPYHVAIVMDGNGRWAQRQGLPRREGHRAGVDNVKRILEASQELDIRILTLYAFSAENWNRPREEVSLLMRMLKAFLEREGRELVRREIRLELAGDPSPLPREVREALDSVMEATAAFRRHALVLALNYGSRQEIVQAARALAGKARDGELDPDAIDYPMLADQFYTAAIPDPDLVIRTSGEYRLSNFLLLQSAYSEFYFSPVCWPDFDGEQLRSAVEVYRNRERRFGKTREQIQQTPDDAPVSSSSFTS